MGEEQKVARILAQRTVPSVVRPPRGRLEVRLPYDPSNRGWLCTGHRSRGDVTWIKSDDDKYWSAPAAWFFELARRLVEGVAGP